MTTLGPDACILGCRDVTLGHLCTGRPGVVWPTGDSAVLCPATHDCTDAIVHRVIGSGIDWHTSGGVMWVDWLRARGVA